MDVRLIFSLLDSRIWDKVFKMTWDKKAMTKWYDNYAEKEEVSNDQIVSVTSARYKRIIRDIEKLISLLSLSNEDRVLDAGCGSGRFIYRIKKAKNCQIFGIDTSHNMIKRAKKKTPDANYLIADILHLPFRHNRFTVVVCYSVLWHIPPKRGLYFNSDVYEKGLKEFKRVLVRNGEMLFNITNPFHLESIIGFFINIIKVKLLKNMGLQTYNMSIGKTQNILTRLGFEISDVVASGYYPLLLETLWIPFYSLPSENLINRYYDSFRHLENSAGAKSLLRSFAHTFVIKAKDITNNDRI